MIVKLMLTLIWSSVGVSDTEASLACVTNPCIYGICIEAPNSLVGGSSGYTCYCIDGYTGVNCQTNWDECWSAPCLNGGTCTDGIAFYNCTCPEGFVGETCEENINECGSNPCLNNGTCMDVANGYMCVCSPGYSGYNCEMDMAVCNTTEEARCANGGTCIEGPGITFTCRCLPGWTDRFCDHPVDECSSSPCENGGVCIDMHAMYVCACPYGYTGMNCETQVELCLTNTCENGALCVVEGRTSICYCVPDYHGERCQFRYDECQKGPGCLNGGTCIDGVDSYTCSCPSDYTGRFCECSISAHGVLNCNFYYTVVPNVTVTTVTTVPFSSTSPGYDETSQSSFSPTTYFTVSSSGRDFTTWVSDQTTTVPVLFSTMIYFDNESSIVTENDSTTEESTFETTQQDISSSTFVSDTYASSDVTTLPTGGSTSYITDRVDQPSTTSQYDTTLETVEIPQTSQGSQEIETVTTEVTNSPFPLTHEATSWVFGTTPTPHFSDFSIPHELNTTFTQSYTGRHTKPYLSTSNFEWTSSTSQMVFRASTEETPFSTELGLDCFRLPCLSGGTCTNTTQGPRCMCNFGWKGKFCEEEEGIKVAAFRGRSYLLHVFGNSTRTAIDLKMRTLAESGIILYAHVSASVYVALYLQQGFLKFQFSCGVQSMLFSELKYSINTGFEMHISAKLDLQVEKGQFRHCNGSVRLNGTLSMSGKQEAYMPFFGQKLNGALYLGGLSRQLHSQVDLPVKRGITACMHSLVINERPREIHGAALDGMDITECESLACLSSPCHNSATCVDIGRNWSCLCSPGYLGNTCERSVCTNNPCKFGGTCVEYPGSGFLCLCPLAKHGMYCDQDLEIGHPLFSSSVSGLSSYIAYPLPGPIHHSFELHFRFLPSTLDQIGLMVFIGQGHPHDSSSDHLAVSFIKGYVVLTWNLGSGPRRIFTPQSVLDGGKGRDVHTVRLGRSGQTGWLQVDAMPNVTGTSPGWLTQLNTRPLIYLGGHESRNFSDLPHDLPLHSGYSGCLYDVELRAGKVRLQIQRSRDAIGRNVGQCLTKHCHNSTCLNHGACMDHGATYACLCQDGWVSPGCALRYNPCDSSRHNCSHGSTCVPMSLGYECDCPLGRTGLFCEKEEKLSDVGFTGKRSYMSLPPAALDLTETCIDLEIRPTASHGIILFSAQQHGASVSFISLSLHGGVIELRVQPIGGHRRSGDVLVVRSGQVVALSQWTRVRAGRYGRRIYLWVDGTVNSGSLLPGEIMLPSHTPLFVGGTEDLSTLPSGAIAGPPVSFSGCVRRLWVNWRSLPLDDQFILGARNIHDCDGTACGGDVCTNGGSCWITPDNRPVCTCLKQYRGERCENVVSCEDFGCEHKGRCITQGKTKSCTCAIGWTGPFCEQGVGQGAPHFDGNSYLVFDSRRAVSKREDDQLSPRTSALYAKILEDNAISYFYINFSTAQHDGMLLWTSKNEDFLGLGIETGMMKIVWGKSTSDKNEMLLPGTSVADGSWHTLTISYHGRAVNFWADRTAAHSYPSNSSIQTDGVFYVGGFPDGRRVVEETDGSFHSRFSGCVREIILNDLTSIVDFTKYDGENLGSCDMMYP